MLPNCLRMGVRVGLLVGWWYHCCTRLARRLAHLMRKLCFPFHDDDDLASRDHLSGASCALAVKVANGGYGTPGGGGRGCSLGVNGCRGDGGGFSAFSPSGLC